MIQENYPVLPARSACLKLGVIPPHLRPADPGDTSAARKSLTRPLQRSVFHSCLFVSIRGSELVFHLPSTIFSFVSPSIHDFHAKNFSRSAGKVADFKDKGIC